MTRDLAAERELLTEAGGSDYAAAARLDESDYGDSFAWCTWSRLWVELAEEALDLGAYCALILCRLEIDDTPRRQLARLRGPLVSIARHGAQAAVLIAEARRLADTIDADATP